MESISLGPYNPFQCSVFAKLACKAFSLVARILSVVQGVLFHQEYTSVINPGVFFAMRQNFSNSLSNNSSAPSAISMS